MEVQQFFHCINGAEFLGLVLGLFVYRVGTKSGRVGRKIVQAECMLCKQVAPGLIHSMVESNPHLTPHEPQSWECPPRITRSGSSKGRGRIFSGTLPLLKASL